MSEPQPLPEPASEEQRVSPRYIGILVAVAGVVLIAGSLLRPGKPVPAPTVGGTELATLPERSQRRLMRDLAGYIGERTGALAASIVYVAEWSASGLVVGPDSVLTVSLAAGPDGSAPPSARTPRVILAALGPSESSGVPAAFGAVEGVSPRWALLVARSDERRPLSLAGLLRGIGRVGCGELSFRELLFDAPAPEAFIGGTMFDLDGNALAMAVPCAGRIAIVPLADLLAVLQLQHQPEESVWARFGFRATEDSITRALLGVDSGRVVTELLVGSPADAAGLRAGDVLVNGLSLAEAAALPPDDRLRVRRRNGAVALEASPDSLQAGEVAIVGGPSRPPPGLSIRRLPAESRGARAGLQVDDRILQIGRDRNPTAVAVQRALADSEPVLLVYERAGHRRVLVLE